MTRKTLMKSAALVGVFGLLVGTFVYSSYKPENVRSNEAGKVELEAASIINGEVENEAKVFNKKYHDDKYPVSIKPSIDLVPEDAERRPADAPRYVAKDEFIDLDTTELHALATCEIECQAKIMTKLRAGESLNPFEIEALRLYAKDMTQTLPLTDDDISMFEGDLKADDSRRKAAARALLATLDTQTQTRIGKTLTGASEDEHRLLGYEFLSRTASSDPEAAQHLRSSLILETNKHILFEVIEAGELDVAAQIAAGNSTARSLALDTLYNTHTDPDVRGSALEAQAKNMQDEGRLQGDIREALISGDTDLQDYGLNSLGIILRRQSTQENGAKWTENGDIRFLIEGFITNPDTDFEVRDRAERIMEQYFNQ